MRTEIPIVVLDNTGRPIQNATVQINVRGGAVATVYQLETGGATFANPLTTDAAGRVTGWLERGAYDAVISATGMTTYTEQFESVPARDAAIDSSWLAPGVAAANLGPGGVTTSLIADSAVTPAKLSAALALGQMQPGVIVDFGGPEGSIPAGWQPCDGRALSQTTYAALFTAISTTWNTSGGLAAPAAGTFRTPDLRGRSRVTKGDLGGATPPSRVGAGVTRAGINTLGQVLGVEYYSLAVAEMPVHSHGGATGGEQAHTHSGTTSTPSANHTHAAGTLAGSTNTTGSHVHAIYNNTVIGSHDGFSGLVGNAGAVDGNVEDPAGDHSHTVSVTSGATAIESQSHTHTVTTGVPSVNHTHSISSQGSGSAHENLHPVAVVNSIIYAGA